MRTPVVGALRRLLFVAASLLAACSNTTEPTSAGGSGSVPATASAASLPGTPAAAHGVSANGLIAKVVVPLAPSTTFPGAKGKAKWVQRTSGFQLEIEVEHIRRLAGQTVSFHLGGSLVGQDVVGPFGNARIVQKTQLGDPVPADVTGMAVEARNQNGVTIASGTF